MVCRSMREFRMRRHSDRRGAVVVEFAIVVPVLVILLLGLVTVSQMCQTSIVMKNALRQGARLAGMDRKGILADGQSTNEKIALDIQNFLEAAGYNGDDATISITHPDTGETLDLDDPANDFELFEVTLELPISGSDGGDPWAVTQTYVFRNARAPTLCD